MMTRWEIEAAVCRGVAHFQQEHMGRRPGGIRAHVVGNLLIIRLRSTLSAAEQELAKTQPAVKGRGLLKKVRHQLIETARPLLDAMVEEATGVKAVSLHHDVSTYTGEE